MRWKRGSSDFLSEKTFLIIKDDADLYEANDNPRGSVTKLKSTLKSDTWPPKLKRAQASLEKKERPKTANLDKPSVLDPELVDKLDMSLLSKELLCDSMSRYRLAKTISGGMESSPASSRRRQSVPALDEHHRSARQSNNTGERYSATNTSLWRNERDRANSYKRRNFEQILENGRNHDGCGESPRMQKQARITLSHDQLANVKKQSVGGKKLDDNNNRNGVNGRITALSIVRKKGIGASLSSDLEVFTCASARSAPEPCRACGRSDQPERFHSHPKGTILKAKEVVGQVTRAPVPKSIQKPVALNFRSDKSRSKHEDDGVVVGEATKIMSSTGTEEETDACKSDKIRTTSAPIKKGPKSVTCYICGREFGTASFPIHEPRCMQKWERENNSLPASQRRPMPQKPRMDTSHSDWNDAAWEQSQEQLVPCPRCGRTFLSHRLPVHQRGCRGSSSKDKLTSSGVRAGASSVPCEVCGRNFGARSIKIHEPQCRKRWQIVHDAQQSNPLKKESALKSPLLERYEGDQPFTRVSAEVSQKRTVTCYICGRDFGSVSIAIHEPQCLKKWRVENDKLPSAQRRPEPQKPEIIFTYESETGKAVVDVTAMAEASWKSHLQQLVPCKRCGRTFNPDRVEIHERSCKGNR